MLTNIQKLYLKQRRLIFPLNLCRFSLNFFTLFCMTCSLLLSNLTQASPSVETKQAIACQQAQQKMQVHFKKEKTIRDKAVVFTKMDYLAKTELNIAYLTIERELLSLAKMGILQHCSFNDLSHVGLEHIVSDDDKFHIYRWATDYEVTESIGYTTIMYAQPKQPNLKPAVYINRNSSGDFSQPITITNSKHFGLDDKAFPIYGIVIKDYTRGQYRIHCEPSISLFQINQRKRFGYIRDIGFKFLDANGKEIDTRKLFGNGCDGDLRTKDYIADNQFSYDPKTQILSFSMSVMTNFDKESLSGTYAYEHYRFRFNGKDFVQITSDLTK